MASLGRVVSLQLVLQRGRALSDCKSAELTPLLRILRGSTRLRSSPSQDEGFLVINREQVFTEHFRAGCSREPRLLPPETLLGLELPQTPSEKSLDFRVSYHSEPEFGVTFLAF